VQKQQNILAFSLSGRKKVACSTMKNKEGDGKNLLAVENSCIWNLRLAREMYRKTLFCVLLRLLVDACHCCIAHAEWTHHVIVVWLAAYFRSAHPRDLARNWSAVFGELNGAV
jgi:hypothetical protein